MYVPESKGVYFKRVYGTIVSLPSGFVTIVWKQSKCNFAQMGTRLCEKRDDSCGAWPNRTNFKEHNTEQRTNSHILLIRIPARQISKTLP